MKKATVYILALVMLLGCFSGCRRNDPMEEMPTPTPAATARPSATARPAQTPNGNDGQVNDNNGIIEDNDGNNVTPDKEDDSLLEDDILNNDFVDDNAGTGIMRTPNPSAATDSNSESKARVRK